jgi:hypothetical protein
VKLTSSTATMPLNRFVSPQTSSMVRLSHK